MGGYGGWVVALGGNQGKIRGVILCFLFSGMIAMENDSY